MLRGRTVLVVEDNEQNMELVEFLLEEANARIIKAEDARTAREAMAGDPPDLVLMDMNIPGSDGTSLLYEIRRRPAWERIPVVALTALAMRGDRERILSAGFQGYISKPINVQTFLSELSPFLPTERKENGR
ncbi:MAG: response regulator [Thermoanaerobaculia bacterium]|nr:Polar-differentiation response regulator DivK [Thermoanaerobaculia bacterium]MCK6684839.1 response regulator [Thermoanaerobaculia bacterium]